jgi:hypothetical protein
LFIVEGWKINKIKNKPVRASPKRGKDGGEWRNWAIAGGKLENEEDSRQLQWNILFLCSF